MHTRWIATSAALALLACSNGGTQTKNEPAKPMTAADAPHATAHLHVAAAGAASPAPWSALAFAAPAGITVDAASVVIAEINFKGWRYESEDEVESTEHENDVETMSETGEQEDAGEAGDESEDGKETEDAEIEGVDFNGPYVVDLLTGKSDPAIDAAVMPSGSYSAVEFKLDGQDDTTGSLAVAGSLAVDGVWYPFTLVNLRDEELKWRFPAPVSLSAAAVNDLVLNVPLDAWVNDALVAALAEAVRSGAVVPGTDGTLAFTSDTEGVGDVLEGNLEHEGDVERDEPGDTHGED